MTPSLSGAKFWAVVYSARDSRIGKGYINRRTLEVALLVSPPIESKAGEDRWLDAKLDREKVERNPGGWVEIPRYDPDGVARYGERSPTNVAKWAQDFFEEERIEIPSWLKGGE